MNTQDLRQTRIEHLDAEPITRIIGQLGHEVGTPLGSILLMSEMLGDALESLGADERQVRRADDLRLAALDVRSVVQGVVHLLRLETGWISPHEGSLDLHHLADDLREKAAGEDLEIEAADDLPERLATDPAFVQEIAAHLFVWHGGRGGRGTLRLAPAAAGLRLELRSPGAEIPWDDEALLDPLGAGDLQPARHHGGGGLELARVRALARRLGGDAEGENVGDGVQVSVEIPAAGTDPLA